MTIRWGYGLFRAWLLATVLWMGFASWAEMRSTQHGPFSDADMGIVAAPAFTRPTPDFDPNVPATSIGRPVTDPAILAQLNAPDNPASKLDMVTTIFGPPLFVLIFGCALWWVVRGFRPQGN